MFASYAQHAQLDAVPELYDIPIELVNRVLYARKSDAYTHGNEKGEEQKHRQE